MHLLWRLQEMRQKNRKNARQQRGTEKRNAIIALHSIVKHL